MVQALLTKTSLRVKIHGHRGKVFTTNVGSPQGDSLSAILFNIYYEAALKSIRADFEKPPAKDEDLRIPKEMQYADDLDFISTSEAHLEQIHEVCSSSLPNWNLKVNIAKTERTRIHISDAKEERGKERWRSSKSLGSLLDPMQDVQRRSELAAMAMNRLKEFWKNKKVSNALKIKLYNAYVKSILLYNCGTWSGAPGLLKKVDTIHRRHLRNLAGVSFPNRISNENLYKLFDESPISREIEKRRWMLFGHVLRMPKDAPAQKSLEVYLNPKLKNRRGRPRITLFSTLQKQVVANLERQLHSLEDLETIRNLAADKQSWKNSFTHSEDIMSTTDID